MEPMNPNSTNQDHDAVENLDEIVAKSGFENIEMAIMKPNPNDQSQEQRQESGGESIKMACPNPNHESQDQEQEENNQPKARNQEKLTRKISEPSIEESATSSSHGVNCATNTCLETKNAESEGNHFCKIFEF